ncbi:MAG TPA: VOC family protein [Pyrinomonadaceae bacterium]|nr:VOC family protein [Pyrinomonadaceae bacterium]
MFLGIRTVIYHVNDLEKAKDWYTRASGVAPYFDQPFYVGFNVGGYELGLDPDGSSDEREASDKSVAYWGVENIESSLKHLLELGATRHTDVQDVGEGIRVATVRDPFGNILGIIQNPHFSLANQPGGAS